MNLNPFRVAKPQTEAQKRADLIAWRALGTGRCGLLLCQTVNPDGSFACRAWGSYEFGGIRYCGHHAPPGAERR